MPPADRIRPPDIGSHHVGRECATRTILVLCQLAKQVQI
jgi:hypothetical protein